MGNAGASSGPSRQLAAGVTRRTTNQSVDESMSVIDMGAKIVALVLPTQREKMLAGSGVMIRETYPPGGQVLIELIAVIIGVCQTFECHLARNHDIPR